MATNNAINIPLPVSVDNGGTGSTSLTDHGVLIGSGTSPIDASIAGLNGQLLVGTGSGGDPVFSSSANGNFTFTSSTSGVNRTVSVSNSDNTSSSSAATVVVSVGGSSTTGDPKFTYIVSGGNAWTIGIDNSLTTPSVDPLVLAADTGLGIGADVMRIATSGEVIRPLQPAFEAYKASQTANVTGDGTLATVTSYTERYDQNNDFASPTFTAPKTGLYHLYGQLRVSGITAGMNTGTIRITTTGGVYKCNTWTTGAIRNASNQIGYGVDAFASMTAGDTATLAVAIGGGSIVADIDGSAGGDISFFCGALIA